MKIRPVLFSILSVFVVFSIYAQDPVPQKILLKTGIFTPSRNIHPDSLRQFEKTITWINGKSSAVIQFQHIPSVQERQELRQAGIELVDYLPVNSYTVSLSRNPGFTILSRVQALSIFQLQPSQKIQPRLASGIVPSWAVKSPGNIEIWFSFYPSFSFEEVRNYLSSLSVVMTTALYKNYHIAGAVINRQQLATFAALPFVEYVQPVPHGDQQLNLISRTNAKGNILNATAAVGGYDLNGEDVTIGVGDDADPQYHIDFTGRLINRGGASDYIHGTHVTGTVAGAGNLLQDYRGYASRSTIISQYYSGIVANAPAYVTDYNMVVANNSYGDIVGDCDYAGTYDLVSRILDLQSESLPNLQHVFAAGNDGNYVNCPPYPAGFQTVLGSYQSAKNVLVVGSTEKDYSISDFSSRGPVKDGRTKPEIMAYGRFLISTYPHNAYGYSSGTSMSSPAVAGGLGLLYQRYRQLHAGADPKNGLMKALICNGADDRGNTGVDYTFGYGSMNLLRSIDMLDNANYLTASVNNSGSNTHNITVPSNTAQLKVMLYWNDPAAAALASTTLVNDLDLELADPLAAVHYPWLLDTVPANVNNTATTGADHINNMEQVVINNPVAGTFTATVKGTAVTQSPPQEYYLVYDIIPVSTLLTYPTGGESIEPGETVTLQWDSYGDPANTFNLEYSTDNGGSWTTINGSVAASLRQYDWVVPNIQTEQALVRITRNSTGLVSTSQAFTILGVPTASLSAIQCEGYISLDWTAVAGATDYEVYRLIGNEMQSLATTGSNNYVFSGLSPDTLYWVAVRARINGKGGKRCGAISRQPNSGTCTGTISDNDLAMDAILLPVSGRIATSTALTATTTIQARIKNLDDAAVNSFDMRYSVNGGGWVTETVNAVVAAGATYTHSFAAPYDFSAAGHYELRVEVINLSAADPVSGNNLMADSIRQIANDPIILPFTDDLETAAAGNYYNDLTGLDGDERYDYAHTFSKGRLSTFLNSGMAYSGNKSLLLDLDGYNAAGNTNYITGTYNLNGLDAATQDIRLDFQYKEHGDSVPSADNSIWVRGDDTAPWIPAYTLSANQNDPGIFKRSKSIEVSDLLVANGQNFSSSFQVRFGQFGYVRIIDNANFQGSSFDDIRLYTVTDDIQMISIDTPLVNSCNLSNATPVRINVRNSSPAIVSNVPVQFSVDGGVTVVEMIPSIGADATLTYTFSATADLSVSGTHTVQTIVQYPSDDFPDNDTLSVVLINSPLVNTFPYLEDFESSNGNWYSSGKVNSWEYGAPASTKINRAASGTRAWKTRLNGNYNNKEASYLYSPCYDISGMTNPTLSFSVALDLEDCGGTLCDGAYMEYSADGITWTRLGAYGSGTNWYNKSGDNVWSVENYTRWHVATTALPTGLTALRLRFVVLADPAVTREGMAVDDIHIYDNTMGIYDGVTMGSPVTQNITGGVSWIDFLSAGKLVASIQPNNENMGNTDVQAYINTGGVRNDGKQYYHDRNITIKPVNTVLTDSVTVRFYFLDAETEDLINASGCASCTKPAMAYELGVSKFSHADDNLENGNITDNIGGTWLFIASENARKVPFDKGYYAEFKVKDFSEFWLNNGGPDNLTTLPVELISFSAKKVNHQDVLLRWETGNEYNVSHFEIELARGSLDFQQGRFVNAGRVNSPGNSANGRSYAFTDIEPGKSGTRYYRLKIVDRDGSFSYSAVKPVIFSNDITWDIYPNPSTGLFSLVYQVGEGEEVRVNIYDLKGRLVKQMKKKGTGFADKAIIDLRDKINASGLYLLEVTAPGIKQSFRLIKQ
ncbi:MAG: S8 family serine peptidase [Terrimonas sp.]|nr:S8 family serine peptidase [Terrimonas sp.]